MVYSAVFANVLGEEKLESVMKYCTPAINACFTLIILNLGAQLSHAAPTVKRYLGMVILPYSGVSLVLTGIAISALTGDFSWRVKWHIDNKRCAKII